MNILYVRVYSIFFFFVLIRSNTRLLQEGKKIGKFWKKLQVTLNQTFQLAFVRPVSMQILIYTVPSTYNRSYLYYSTYAVLDTREKVRNELTEWIPTGFEYSSIQSLHTTFEHLWNIIQFDSHGIGLVRKGSKRINRVNTNWLRIPKYSKFPRKVQTPTTYSNTPDSETY